MCYLKNYKPEERVDIDGTPIKWGDIVQWLESYDDCWKYQGVLHRGNGLEIRDFNAFNIGYCSPGPNGNMRRVGNVFEDEKAYYILLDNGNDLDWFGRPPPKDDK